MNKKILLIGLILVMAFSSFSCKKKKDSSKDLSWEDIKKRGYFVVGLDDQFPPMGFRSKEDNSVIGFDIDLAKAVAKAMGVEVQFKPVAWDGIIFSLNKGDIDVIWNGLTITEERKQRMSFSKPYLQNRQIIITLKDSKIENKDDMANKIIGIQLGSSSEVALRTEPKVMKSFKDIRKYETNMLAILDLKAKRVDAVVVDEIVGRYYIKKDLDCKYKILDENFGTEAYGIGYRMGDKAFGEKLDEALNTVIKNGTSAKISKEWFDSDIVLKEDIIEK